MAIKLLKEGEEGFIYTLTDPNTNLVRYVGKAKSIENRFKEHIKKAKLGKHIKIIGLIHF